MRPMFCPHCNNELFDHDEARGGRCSACRLVVGAGRTRAEPSGEALAAGFTANAARREAAEPIDEQVGYAALHKVALARGVNVERMRMVDYERATREDPALPTVAQLLATFDTWKAARVGARGTPQAAHQGSRVEAEIAG